MRSDVQALLDPAGPAPLVVVTLGNEWRGDDALGPCVAARLAGRTRPGCMVVDAGEWPENALDPVTALKPGRVVILDAADFGGAPGEARVIPKERLPATAMSTHRFPPAALAALIEADTGAPVFFLGVQVKTVQPGAALSAEVQLTVDALAACLENRHA